MGLVLGVLGVEAQTPANGETLLIPNGTVRARSFDTTNTLVELVFSLTYVDYSDRLYLNFGSPQQSLVIEIEPALYYPMVASLLEWSNSRESRTAREYRTFEAIRVAWRTGSAVAGTITDVEVRFAPVEGVSAALLFLETPDASFRTIVLDADQRLAAR